MTQKANKSKTISTQQKSEVSENTVGNVNIQHMTGVDRRIENYERMVGNLFVGQTMTPQKIAIHINRTPSITVAHRFRK